MDPSNKQLDDLLEIKLFHCAHCENLLQTPVMLVENLGNVCRSCYEIIKSKEDVYALENTAMSTILEIMEIPCENKSRGCTERIQYDKIREHEAHCIYQNFRCRAPDQCSWIGCLRDFLGHYRETHTERHFEYQNDTTFFLDVEEKKLEGVHLLDTSYGDFFLDVNKTDRDIRFFIHPVSRNIDDLEYSFSVTFVGEKGKEFSSTCQIVDSRSFVTANYDEYDSTTEINLEYLEYIFKNKAFRLIKIILSVADDNNVGNAVLRNLECQNCKLYPKSEVLSCHSGHIFCSTCVNKGTAFCGHPVSKNVALSKIVENTRLPCRFMSKGCRVKMLMNSKHDSLCYFKDWQCAISSCDFSGSYTALINHSKQFHKSNCFTDTSHIEINSKSATEDHYLMHDDHMFHLSYKHTSTSSTYGGYSYKNYVTWAVDIIGLTEQLYSYEIEMNFKQLCMKFKAPCSYKGDEMAHTTYNHLFAFGAINLIKLPSDIFEQVNGKCPNLKYTIKIFKDEQYVKKFL